MTDKELLELAAKAAGLSTSKYWHNDGTHCASEFEYTDGPHGWNPLTDDGDALRLAVKLHINIRYTWDGCDDQYDSVYAERGKIMVEEQIGMFKLENIDEYAATRRCIVRAAAAIGKTLG